MFNLKENSDQLSHSLLSDTMTVKDNTTAYAGVPNFGSDPNSTSMPVATAIASAGEVDSSFGSSLPTATKLGKTGNNNESSVDLETIRIDWEKGEAQPPEYRDKWFAAAFLAHLLAIFGTAIAYGGRAASLGTSGEQQEDVDANANDNTSGDGSDEGAWILAATFVAIVLSPTLSFAALGFMSKNAELLIRISLWFSFGLCVFVAVISFLVGSVVLGLIYGLFSWCLAMYARAVRHKIPYAASNLRCGIQAIQSNMGIGFASIGSIVFLTLFSLTWGAGFVGTMQLDSMKAEGSSSSTSDYYGGNYQSSTSDSPDELSGLGTAVALFFLLSFYWTHQVATNLVRTSVSGVVGTWWFSPHEASACCSLAVKDSVVRSATYSLGSVCFGSLIVAVIQVIRSILRSSSENNRGGGILRCVAACLLYYIELIVEYFNKWAFIYVGLYGYDYMTAGKRVMSLFKTRGWSTIISDNLVNRLLGLVSLSIGLLVGLATLLVSFFIEEFESKTESLPLIGFIIGFAIGIIISSIVMSLLSSSVDAIIVCYAEAPQEFSESHPALAQEMHASWSAAWPDLISTGPTNTGGIV